MLLFSFLVIIHEKILDLYFLEEQEEKWNIYIYIFQHIPS